MKEKLTGTLLEFKGSKRMAIVLEYTEEPPRYYTLYFVDNFNFEDGWSLGMIECWFDEL